MTRSCSTICLPIRKEDYLDLIESPTAFRAWLDRAFDQAPELFPEDFDQGYRLKDRRCSKKTGLIQRRIQLLANDQACSIRPGFVMPYMTAWTDEVEGPWFLRAFGVPYWALARIFGKDAMYWYRMEVSLGRNSIVGTTVRKVAVPEHMLADEHHRKRDGEKNYVATTVAQGCCLGSALAQTAGTQDLQAAYGARTTAEFPF